MTREEKTRLSLEELEIPFYEEIPAADEGNTKLRSLDEIVKRVVAGFYSFDLAQSIYYAEPFPELADMYKAIICTFNAQDYLTDSEHELFAEDSDDFVEASLDNMDLAFEIIFRGHACQLLLWVLGLNDNLDFPTEEDSPVQIDRSVFEKENLDSFKTKIKFRDLSEILDKADLIFHIDYACAKAVEAGDDIPAGVSYEIVSYIKKTFLWLFGKIEIADFDDE